MATPYDITLATRADCDLGRRSLAVAPDLIGAVIAHGPVAIMITEVEAYEGLDDPASHAWKGPTPRSQVMFGPARHVYVYLSHGLHHAMNLICGPDGTASAVLLRAGRVVRGLPEVHRRRPGIPATAPARLARGPGNLARSLGVDLTYNGARLVRDPDPEPPPAAEPPVAVGPRVGVSRAADRPWRFWWDGDPTVSAYRRSPRAEKVGWDT